MNSFEVIIVGQGLAGTALAWSLRRRGVLPLVIDRGREGTSSRIAAGLVTPVTGQRMAVSWRFAELFPFAERFYRDIEKDLGLAFFHRQPMVRLFLNQGERHAFASRADTLLRGLVQLPALVDESRFHCEHGGFVMPDAARLDTIAYLDASQKHFAAEGGFLKGEVHTQSDLDLHNADTITLPRLGLRTRRLIFCQGFEFNSHFPAMPFNSVKGEVLTLRIESLEETRVVHRGVWLASHGNGQYRAGATYDRDRLDAHPTPAGRLQIEAKLRSLLRWPYEVLDHHAGVRPVLLDGRPILGFHAQHPGLGVFNGLGSKGALIAPFFAAQLAEAIVTGVPPEYPAP